MTDGIIQARRRIVLIVIVAIVSLSAGVLPGPRAKLELTTARISVMIEAGSLRFRAFASKSGDTVVPAGLTLSIGRFAR